MVYNSLLAHKSPQNHSEYRETRGGDKITTVITLQVGDGIYLRRPLDSKNDCEIQHI